MHHSKHQVQVFLVDMILRFVLPFHEQDQWIKDPHNIVAHYIRSWFFPDLISIFPFDMFLSGTHTEYDSCNQH